jgi:hypothetical protein
MSTESRRDRFIALKMKYEEAARKSRGGSRRQFEKLAATYDAMALAEMKKAAVEAAAP